MEDIDKTIIELYKSGLSGAKVSKQTGVSATQIRRILKKYGIEARSNKTDDNIEQEIIKQYNNNISSETIAESFGLDPATICRILKRNNIQIKGAEHFNKKYEINEDYFKNIDCESKAYFLGFWCADGYVHSNRDSIRLCLHKQDVDVLEKFKSLVYVSDKELDYDDKYISLYVYSKVMRNDLISHGCVPVKTFKLTLPNIDSSLMNHFFRGFYDGDGCIYISNVNYVTVTLTGYIKFLEEIKLHMRNIDINGNCRTIKHKELVGEFAVCAQKEVKKLLEYLYKDATVYLDRKYQKYLRALEIFDNKHIGF
jgi:intein-encoded DNA endonuclease-like protein